MRKRLTDADTLLAKMPCVCCSRRAVWMVFYERPFIVCDVHKDLSQEEMLECHYRKLLARPKGAKALMYAVYRVLPMQGANVHKLLSVVATFDKALVEAKKHPGEQMFIQEIANVA